MDAIIDPPYIVYIAIAIIHFLLLILLYKLLVRFLNLEWRINSQWFPVFAMCIGGVYFLASLPTIVNEVVLERINFSIPLLMTIVEYISSRVLCSLFEGHRNNDVALAFAISYMLTPLEIIRFASFAMAWIKFVSRGELLDITFNIVFSILGEVYTHTQYWLLCKTELQIRFYGRRFDDFSKLYHYISSIRSHLEYVAPIIFSGNILLTSKCGDYFLVMTEQQKYILTEGNERLMEYIFPILGAYYLQEFSSEIICWGLRTISSYKRISAIAGLSWPVLLMMIVVCGSVIESPLAAAGFLRILPHNSTEMAASSEQPIPN